MIKASIDTLSWVACLHLVHLKFFPFFFSPAVHLHLFVCVSSGSPYLPHPSLSLCFPTVIDSSLQSLTAAHQHLLRSGETERRCMCVGECALCDVSILINRKEQPGMSLGRSLTFEWLFSDSHSSPRVSSLSPLYGPWSWGTSYYATHVGTMVCCYGDCQGSQSIIGVYPRQEQGYSPSIRTRFHLPHSLDHTLRSKQSQRDKGRNLA